MQHLSAAFTFHESSKASTLTFRRNELEADKPGETNSQFAYRTSPVWLLAGLLAGRDLSTGSNGSKLVIYLTARIAFCQNVCGFLLVVPLSLSLLGITRQDCLDGWRYSEGYRTERGYTEQHANTAPREYNKSSTATLKDEYEYR